jgi:squalene-hopene/tetraprenyl-beta-curcumene cyclase
MERNTLQETLDHARKRLLASWTERGSFCGLLSSSALSTATATMALQMSARAARKTGAPRPDHERLAEAGRDWLCENQNPDGGWGDTVDSPTNISTTTLAWACLGLVGNPSETVETAVTRAEQWLELACGTLSPDQLAQTIRASYGKDHTFSVPILTTCALGERLGEDGWRHVPGLPFELAACPHQLFPLLRLRTVSYALPALIAIGQAKHYHRPTWNPVLRVLRILTVRRTLGILQRIQPKSGGFLEAAPLTSFVSMSLISMGLHEHPVAVRALNFLAETVRDDGCWPIDTNLDTWTTTLSINALAGAAKLPLDRQQCTATREWLLGQQYREEHPYTHAAPGGWAWTDLSGGVPDADDTAGALLALRTLYDGGSEADKARLRDAAGLGISWLLDIQNRDGGIPTFCRGWGKLPFDRSSPDLTAHALRAFAAWAGDLPGPLENRVSRATKAAARYLIGAQDPNGAWVPLWFGNQQEPRQENPLYGTSRVLRAMAEVRCGAPAEAGRRAAGWILTAQGSDGGFGGGPSVTASIEETALALEALAAWAMSEDRYPAGDDELRSALERGAEWLSAKTEQGTRFDPAPIGLYFARLWYSERLYPLIFTVSALELVQRSLALPTPVSG